MAKVKDAEPHRLRRRSKHCTSMPVPEAPRTKFLKLCGPHECTVARQTSSSICELWQPNVRWHRPRVPPLVLLLRFILDERWPKRLFLTLDRVTRGRRPERQRRPSPAIRRPIPWMPAVPSKSGARLPGFHAMLREDPQRKFVALGRVLPCLRIAHARPDICLKFVNGMV